MSSITRTSNAVMTDLECLNEALESSDCKVHSSSGTRIIVTAEGRRVTISRSSRNGHWSYRYEQGQDMGRFNSWFRRLEETYAEIVRQKQRRIEAEKQRQRELAEEAGELRQQAARTQTELDSKSRDRLSELESTIARSKEALDEAQRRLDSVEQSRMEYVTSTESELKERAQEGGWNLARDVHDPSKRLSRIRWTRKKVSN